MIVRNESRSTRHSNEFIDRSLRRLFEWETTRNPNRTTTRTGRSAGVSWCLYACVRVYVTRAYRSNAFFSHTGAWRRQLTCYYPWGGSINPGSVLRTQPSRRHSRFGLRSVTPCPWYGTATSPRPQRNHGETGGCDVNAAGNNDRYK